LNSNSIKTWRGNWSILNLILPVSLTAYDTTNHLTELKKLTYADARHLKLTTKRQDFLEGSFGAL